MAAHCSSLHFLDPALLGQCARANTLLRAAGPLLTLLHAMHLALQVLDDFATASPEEREEEYEGGTPYSPFVAMLQVSLQQGGTAGSSKESKGCCLGCVWSIVAGCGSLARQLAVERHAS